MNKSLYNSSRRMAFGAIGFVFFIAIPVSSQTVEGKGAVPALASGSETIIKFRVLPGANLLGARVGVSDAGGTAILSDGPARVVGTVGAEAEVSVRLEGDAGLYDIRLWSPDKKVGLSEITKVMIPGVRREAGAWRINGDVITEVGPEIVTAPPTFLANLKREGKAKMPLAVSAGTDQVKWRTLRLPALEKWQDSPWTAADIQQEMNRLGGTLVGVEFPVGDAAVKLPPVEFAGLLKVARDAVKTAAPTAGTILEVEASHPEVAAALLDGAAPLFDAVVVKYSAYGESTSLWPLKVARRIAEEQKDFDLPIFVRVEGASDPKKDQFLLDALIGGATGLILPPGVRPEWSDKIELIRPLLAQAVTLEDAPIRRDPGAIRLATILRQSGRIPLLGRLPKDDKSRGESCFVTLNSATTVADLDGIKRAAGAGSVIYMEGMIPGADKDTLAKLTELTGTVITPLAKEESTYLTLDDPWAFGTYSKAQLPVRQSVKIEVRQSMAAQTRTRPGMDSLTIPRFVAHLSDSDGGLVEFGVGKGKVIWLPHRFEGSQRSPDLRGYYGAIAGMIQGAILRFKPVDGVPVPFRGALRLSQGKSSMIEVLNAGDRPVETDIVGRGVAETLLDASTGEKIDFTTRGNETTFRLKVPANGWRLIVFSASAKDLAKEREARKWKVKVK